MKVYLKNGTMIECTVDEFEELYTRGFLGENGMQKALDDFIKETPGNPIPQNPIKFPRNTEIMVYGCGMPSPLTCQSTDTTTTQKFSETTSDSTSITPIHLPNHNNVNDNSLVPNLEKEEIEEGYREFIESQKGKSNRIKKITEKKKND